MNLQILTRVLALLFVVAAGVLGTEIGLRHFLGLGDPPLVLNSPVTGYQAMPSRVNRRLGNELRFNRWSMRSDEFSLRKLDPSEYRVLMLGDSVIHGGNWTDQRDLASEIVRSDLQAEQPFKDRIVIVGNISAGSWGPANQLNYLREYGLFDADVIVLVVSSHDAEEDFAAPPAYSYAQPAHSAIGELLGRLVGGSAADPGPPGLSRDEIAKANRERSMHDFAAMLELVRASGARLIVVQHPEARELDGVFQPGHEALLTASREAGVEPIQLAPLLKASRDAGRDPFRSGDPIHINEIGQAVLADAILTTIKAELSSP